MRPLARQQSAPTDGTDACIKQTRHPHNMANLGYHANVSCQSLCLVAPLADVSTASMGSRVTRQTEGTRGLTDTMYKHCDRALAEVPKQGGNSLGPSATAPSGACPNQRAEVTHKHAAITRDLEGELQHRCGRGRGRRWRRNGHRNCHNCNGWRRRRRRRGGADVDRDNNWHHCGGWGRRRGRGGRYGHRGGHSDDCRNHYWDCAA